jgi:AcrR family transcriptional regulator
VRHSTAVQYHFGDKEGLLDAVMADHHAAVELRRDAMLEHYEITGAIDLRVLAAILVQPLAAELADERGRQFLRIYVQTVTLPMAKNVMTSPSLTRWRTVADPVLPPDAARLHPRFTALGFACVQLARRAFEQPRADDRLFVSRLVDVAAAILGAPVSAETNRLWAERRQGQV